MKKLCVPPEILNQHIVALGKTGAGKSSMLRYLAEYLLAQKKRICIIDPKGDHWGLKFSADGKEKSGFSIIAFGDFKEAKASDIPLNRKSGKHVGELLTSGNRPSMIGFRGWSPSDMREFWIDFASTLFNTNSGELYLIIDEVHNFAPKGKILDPKSGEMIHWTNRVLSEGRGLGLVCIIASQRPQKVHNDTLTCCETLIAMKVNHASDREAVKDWIDGCGDKEQGKIVLNNIASLGKGETYVWSPEIGFGPERIQFPKFSTFDSFAPPQLQPKLHTKDWSSVNLEDVKEKLSAVIKEAQDNDPVELKKKILMLEKQLRNIPQQQHAKIEHKEIPVLKDSQIERLEKIFGKQIEISQEILQAIKSVTTFKKLPVPLQRIITPTQRPQREYTPRPAIQSSGIITGGLKRMLIALAQVHPKTLDKAQIGVRAGLSSNSGTFGTYLGTLRSSGYVTGNGLLQITPEGLNVIGEYEPLPTGHELFLYWKNWLGDSGKSRMLEALVEAYPQTLTKEELGNQSGVSHTSGTFGTYLGELRTLQLVEGTKELKASDDLF